MANGVDRKCILVAEQIIIRLIDRSIVSLCHLFATYTNQIVMNIVVLFLMVFVTEQ